MKDKSVSNGFGIASFVLGILAIFVSFLNVVAIPFIVLSIIFAAIQMKRKSTGLAIAGLVLGIISIFLALISFFYFYNNFNFFSTE